MTCSLSKTGKGEVVRNHTKTYRPERESKVKSISIPIKERRMLSSILVALYYRLPSQIVFEDDIFLVQIIF